MNIFIFSILIFFSTEAMIDVGLAGLSQMKVSVRYYGQTLAGKDSESPGSSISCLSGQADKQRTAFLKFGQPDSRQTPDRIFWKIRIKTRHGQRRPPTSDYGKDLSWVLLAGTIGLNRGTKLVTNVGEQMRF